MTPFEFVDTNLHVHHTLTESPREEDFDLHAHDLYEIYYFIAGQGYYTIEGHDYPLTPGCILLMRDGETHKLHIYAGRPYERIVVHFSPKLFDAATQKVLLAAFRDRPLGQKNMYQTDHELANVRRMLTRLTDFSVPSDEYRQRTLAYLPAILFEISVATQYTDVAHTPASDIRPLVGEMIDYINEDPAAVGNMESLEQRFGFSRSYLNRTFRQSTGVSIWDYVILKRLTQARNAIRTGTAAAAAAAEAGYTDYSSFYRQYKKRFGITPEEEKKLASPKKR